MTYLMTSSRRSTQKSVSISGIEMRSGLRKRSKIRLNLSGSRSVIFKQYETTEPTAEPRPGPTGMSWSRAYLMKSHTIRKYDAKPILMMTSSSYSNRSRSAASSARARRRSARSSPASQISRRYSCVAAFSAGAVGLRHRDTAGRWKIFSGILMSMRLAISTRVIARFGQVGPQLAHLVRATSRRTDRSRTSCGSCRRRSCRCRCRAARRAPARRLLLEVVRVVGRDDRDVQLARDLDQALVDRLLPRACRDA